MSNLRVHIFFITAAVMAFNGHQGFSDEVPQTLPGETICALDGERQPLLFWAPETATTESTPLLVFLHS